MGDGRSAVAAVLAALVLAVAACAREEEGSRRVPVACLEGPDAVSAALRTAPGEVSIEGTRISQCFVPASDPADVQALGASLVEVADALAEGARRDPEGREAAQLGYLLGAVRRGSDGTAGIHQELVRRLELALVDVRTSARAYREGEQAGRAAG